MAAANAKADRSRIIPKWLDPGAMIGEGLVNWGEQVASDSLHTMGMLTQGDSTSRLSLSNFYQGAAYGELSNAPIIGSGAKACESSFYDPGSNSVVQQSGGERFRQGGLSVAEFGLTLSGGMLGEGLAGAGKGIPGGISAKASVESSVHRVVTPGKPQFQLRQGETGLSVFDASKVGPEDILPHFREGSQIVTRPVSEIKAQGLTVGPTPGDAGLPQHLQDAHMEIGPGSDMTRNQFKQAIKKLE